jgi:hypothetical protein
MHLPRRKIIIALASLAVASIFLVLVASLAVQGQGQKKLETLNPANMDTMYHAYAVTGTSGDSVTLNVLNTVVKNKDNSVLTKDLTPPTPVQYFYANDTVKFGGQNRMTLGELQGYARTDYDAATINVAGASAVMAAKHVGVSMKDGGVEFQIPGFTVYLPDGTVKTYKFDTPLKASMALGSTTMSTAGNPQLKAALQDIAKEGAKFPANAAPIKIKDIDAKIK